MSTNESFITSRYQEVINGEETTRLGVALGLIDLNKRILLERRSDNGWWGITGGRIEPCETPEECAIREVIEETGLVVNADSLRLLGVYGDPKDGRILQYPDCRVHLIDIVYYSVVDIQQPLRLSEESFELRFFTGKNLPSTIVPPAQRPLNDLINRRLI